MLRLAGEGGILSCANQKKTNQKPENKARTSLYHARARATPPPPSARRDAALINYSMARNVVCVVTVRKVCAIVYAIEISYRIACRACPGGHAGHRIHSVIAFILY